MELFRRHRMYDKERLFQYRRVSRVNIYSIGGFEDYYYGYMVQNTGYLKYFDLKLYKDGVLLLLPERSDPRKVAQVPKLERIYQTLRETGELGKKLQVSTVGDLNEQITSGRMNELILVQEALMEKKLGDIAEMIGGKAGQKDRDDCRPVLLRQDYVFPPFVDPAACKGTDSPSHCSR